MAAPNKAVLTCNGLTFTSPPSPSGEGHVDLLYFLEPELRRIVGEVFQLKCLLLLDT